MKVETVETVEADTFGGGRRLVALVTLSGDDVARAIYAYLVANGLNKSGPSTIRIEPGAATGGATVLVEGWVFDEHNNVLYGRSY